MTASTADPEEPLVLLVDDDAALVQTLAINLRARGWRVATAADGAGALRAAEETRPAVVVLDLGLPDLDGRTVLAELRKRSQLPVIVLSARQEAAEKIEALDVGADDYVTKPFVMEELLARLRAARRRVANAASSTDLLVETGELVIDLGRQRVSRGGTEVRLTPTEWHLLEVLVRRRGRLVSQLDLLQEVWGDRYRTETNYLRVYTAQLRRKLEIDPAHPRHLITEPGRGYRFEA